MRRSTASMYSAINVSIRIKGPSCGLLRFHAGTALIHLNYYSLAFTRKGFPTFLLCSLPPCPEYLRLYASCTAIHSILLQSLRLFNKSLIYMILLRANMDIYWTSSDESLFYRGHQHVHNRYCQRTTSHRFYVQQPYFLSHNGLRLMLGLHSDNLDIVFHD